MLNVVLIRSSAFKTQRLSKYAKYLSKKGLNVTILYWERGVSTSSEELAINELIRLGIRVEKFTLSTSYGTGIKSAIKRFKWLFFVRKSLIKLNPDYIHAIDLDSALVNIIHHNRCVKVVDFADFLEDYPYRFANVIAPFLGVLSFFVYFSSHATILPTLARKKWYMLKNVFEVNNAPMVSDLSEFESSSSNGAILYCGTLGKDRGLDILSNAKVNLPIIVAGWGELEEKVKKSKSINYIGHVDYKNVLLQTGLCKFVYCVYDPKVAVNRFSDPNKFYEALLLGKPLIVARGTGIDCLVEELGLGLVIDYNVDSLESSLNRFSERDYLAAMENIKQHRSKFLWGSSEEQLNQIYLKAR
ncbi:conserved hypothetical protein [Vibrio chagasii]|nr:conserved hypothetical protein [Vibrio chagasii]